MKEFVQYDSDKNIVNVITLDDCHCSDCDENFCEIMGITKLKKIVSEDYNYAFFDREGQISDGSLFLHEPHQTLIGSTYDENLKKVILIKPYVSWVLDESTGIWNPPIPKPVGSASTMGAEYDIWIWDEENLCWAPK